MGARGQTARRLGDHFRFRQEGSSVRSAIKCAFASTATKRRAEDDRLLPHLRCETEAASWKKTSNASRGKMSANDSELLLPIFASLVAGDRCEGYVSIWSRCPSD